MSFESMGVCLDYIKGTLVGAKEITIYLPKKYPFCSRCEYFREHTLERFSCRLDRRWLFNPQKERDENCPVLWEDE